MRKLELFVIFSTIVLIIISIHGFIGNEILTNVAAPLFWPSNVSCYFMKSREITELGSGEWDEAMLIPDRCIFFLETTCYNIWGTGDIILDQKRACAIETAAKTNPTSNIFLIYLTPKKFTKESAVFRRKLESYENIYVRRLKIFSHFDETPLKNWFSRNMRNILDNENPQKSIFDLVKITMLWKYGGIFVDPDFILETPLEEFTNFVVKWKNKNSEALLGVGISTELGKNFVNFAIDEIAKSNETRFNTMRSVDKFCNKNMHTKKNCEFTIYPSIKQFSHSENNTENCPRVMNYE